MSLSSNLYLSLLVLPRTRGIVFAHTWRVSSQFLRFLVVVFFSFVLEVARKSCSAFENLAPVPSLVNHNCAGQGGRWPEKARCGDPNPAWRGRRRFVPSRSSELPRGRRASQEPSQRARPCERLHVPHPLRHEAPSLHRQEGPHRRQGQDAGAS